MQKTSYAIRAMQHLADRYGEGPDAQNIPANLLTAILSELSRLGIVASQREKDGGYWLAVSPIDITYGDLIRAALIAGTAAFLIFAWNWSIVRTLLATAGCGLLVGSIG